MNRFIRINGKEFSFEEVAKALGVECDPQREPVQLHLCQRIDEGVLVAKGAFFDKDSYPAIDLDLELPAEKDSMSVPIFKVEQPRVDGAYSDGYQGVRSFVYNRDGEYFMYSNVDSRADEIVDRDGMEQWVMVSGSPRCDVEVYQENYFVRMMGRRDFDYTVASLEWKNVELTAGMVGKLRDLPGIKKSLRGKAFEILDVNAKDGFAACRIEGETGTFSIYVSQMEGLRMPEAVEKPVSEVLEEATSRAEVYDGNEAKEIGKEGLF